MSVLRLKGFDLVDLVPLRHSCAVFGVGSCPNLVLSESGYHLAMCSFH